MYLQLPKEQVALFKKMEKAIMLKCGQANVGFRKNDLKPQSQNGKFKSSVETDLKNKDGEDLWKGDLACFKYVFPTDDQKPTSLAAVKNEDKVTHTYATQLDDEGKLKTVVGYYKDFAPYSLVAVRVLPTVVWENPGAIGLKWKATKLTVIFEEDPPAQPVFSATTTPQSDDEDDDLNEISKSAGDYTHAAMSKGKKRAKEPKEPKEKKAKKAKAEPEDDAAEADESGGSVVDEVDGTVAAEAVEE